MTTATENAIEQNRMKAETIFSQMGGTRRLAVMAGAKNFSYGTNDENETYAQFRIGRNANRMNLVRITLNSRDTYRMEFMWATINKVTVKKEFDDVYFDMLVNIFERSTGMYLSI